MSVAYFRKLLFFLGALMCLTAFSTKAQPTATISVDVSSVCQGGTSPVVTFTGANGNAPFTFSFTINGAPNSITTSSGSSVTVDVPTTTPGTFVFALVSVTDNDGNSQAQTDQVSVTVNAPPTVTLGAFADVCSNTASFALTGGSPGGGTFSGPGVSGGNFDPGWKILPILFTQ